MLYKKFLCQFFGGILILLLGASCSNVKKEQAHKKETIVSNMDEKNSYSLSELDSFSSKKIKKWKEYFDMNDFLKEYKEITGKEALDNSHELKELVKIAKDSNDVKDLQTAAFRARMNVFENEVLRLADLTYITTISAKEVEKQIKNVFLTFKSLNSKIENTYKKQQFNKSIKLDSVFDKVR